MASVSRIIELGKKQTEEVSPVFLKPPLDIEGETAGKKTEGEIYILCSTPCT